MSTDGAIYYKDQNSGPMLSIIVVEKVRLICSCMKLVITFLKYYLWSWTFGKAEHTNYKIFVPKINYYMITEGDV